jgi:hypothetical protein
MPGLKPWPPSPVRSTVSSDPLLAGPQAPADMQAGPDFLSYFCFDGGRDRAETADTCDGRPVC